MKSKLKLFGFAAIIAIIGSTFSAQARSPYEGEVQVIGSRVGQQMCGISPNDGHCRPMRPPHREMMPWPPKGHPHHQRHGGYIQPGFSLEFQFGNVHPRREYHRRPIIQKVRYCTNDMAVNKAQSFGIHRIRAYAYPGYILIKGKKRGHRVEVSFSRARGCPVISY